MYAVIFRAEINDALIDGALINGLADSYSDMVQQLRDLALQEYGCVEFTSVTEGKDEISISYWENLAQIKNWKQDPKHLVAQDLGRTQFYKSVKVQVVDILREY